MFAFRSRVTAIAAGLVLFAITPAHAQVTIQLTTTQQTACTVVTDANGLTLVPGGTNLQATGVTLSGPGCGGGGGGTPPSPPNFLLTLPAAGNVGTSFQVSWSVTNATSCTGSADLAGSSASLPGWTDVSTATSPRQVTANVPGIYTLRLTCSNSAGSVTSTPGIITITQTGGDTCPAGRQTTATVCYNYNMPGSSCSNNADVTQAKNIWGRTSPGDTIVDFPFKNYFAILANMQKTQYIAAKFHVGATGLSPTMSGFFSHGETLPGPNVTMSISPTCGDFNPSTSICLRSNQPPGGTLVKYRLPTGTGTLCVVSPGQDYFINLKMTNPPATHQDCNSTTCKVTTTNSTSD